MSEADADLLRRAVELAVGAAETGGGPFGAVVVRTADGTVVGTGTNRVVPTSDPTAHAEIVALRDAAAALGTHVLAGCVLYSSCEPCPMCLAAAFWARVDRVVFAAGRADANAAGFDDERLYDELSAPLPERRLPIEQVTGVDELAPFRAWAANPDRRPY